MAIERSRARAGRGRTGRWPSSTRSISASTRPKRRSRRSKAEAAERPRTGASADDDPPRRRRLHPGDDADPHLSGARASRRQPRSARPRPARTPGRPHARLSRLHRRRPRPADLPRRHARLRICLGAADPPGAAGQLLRPRRPRIYAHQRPGGAPLPAGPDGGQGRRDQLHARRQALDPGKGDPRRAVGKIPRQEICRHQALRARRRRERDPRAGSDDQIWRRRWASRRSTSACPIADGSTFSPT